MARGRRGSYDSGVIVLTRRRDIPLSVDPEYQYRDSRKAQRISDFALEDAEFISNKSRNKDKHLLDSITQRLNRVEFDGVKLSNDVAMKTGFRRKLYHKKLPSVEKETREMMKKDKLKYPWDYTVDNIYRPTKSKSKNGRNKTDKVNKDKNDQNDLEPLGRFPEYDPMGVYKQRPKREHKELPPLNQKNKYDDMNLPQKLATVRAKVLSMPYSRDASKDIDTALAVINRPLPKSKVAGENIVTVDDYYGIDANMERSGLDDHLAQKIKASRGELERFEHMLNERFGVKKELRMCDILGRKLNIPPPPPPYRFDYDEEQRELGLENGPTIAEPVIVHHVQAPRIVPRTATRVAHARTAAPRVRSSSLPPISRGVPRRSRVAEIEVDDFDDISDYEDVDDVNYYDDYN